MGKHRVCEVIDYNWINFYKIVNVNGQIVVEGSFASTILQKDVDLSLFTAGVYNIQITIAETVINKKIVVMNK